MGNVKAAGEADGHRDAGDVGTLDQGFADRVQDDETAVTEDRDGNDPAHEFDREAGVLFTDQFDDHIGQLQRRAGLFQHGTDEGTQNDHDTDRGKGAGEAGADNVGDLGQRDAGQNGQQQGNAHDRQEGMDLQLGDEQDHRDDSHNKGDDKCNARHK